jgi:predicted metalloprotease with PDZ domain
MPATFMWARGIEDRPIRVDFRPPDGSGWQVATQLVPTDQPFTFTAPNLAYLLDSPTHLGAIDVREWAVGSGGEYTIRLAVHHDGTPEDLDAFEDGVRRIVETTAEIWGGYPEFDFGTYTFVAAYLPWVDGDGMEHRNSTSLTSSGSIGRNRLDLLGTVAHEFFHAWNVERLRPASLEPFDFEQANMSRELWFAEGFTSYYTTVILRRAGLIDTRAFAADVGHSISEVVNSPGRGIRSPVEMSMHAPFVDQAASIDPTNEVNTFLSYYTWGSVVGGVLDLTLRQRFGGIGLSLDSFMRAMWERFGASETPYTLEDLEDVLGQLTDDPVFATEFFDFYVRGRLVPDFDELLAPAGMTTRQRNPNVAWIGSLDVQSTGEGALVASYPLMGTPLYEAGLTRGDRIVSINGRDVLSEADLREVLSELEPGDEVTLRFHSRGTEQESVVEAASDPAIEVVLFEEVGRPVSPAVTAFRRDWLGG